MTFPFNRICIWIVGCFVVVFIAGCLSKDTALDLTVSEDARERAAIRAVATVGMVADLVREVGDDRVSVTQLMGPGVDPHLYKGTRDDVRAILAADVVFFSGLMLEGKLASVFERLQNRKQVFAVTQPLSTAALMVESENPEHIDPHVWMDVSLWMNGLQVVTDSLCALSPQHATEFRESSEAYRQQLMKLHEYGQAVMSTVPAQGRVLVTSHDAFQYFGQAYGLEVHGVQGFSTDSEAGLTQINALVDMIVERKIAAVFVESSVPQKSMEAVTAGVASRGHRVRIGGELYSDAMGPAGTYEGTYVGMLDHNLTTVAIALGGQAPPRGMQGRLSHAVQQTIP